MQNKHFIIDKTEVMEKGVLEFPSLYIEGAAATGKSTAVELLLSRHAQVCSMTFDMKRECQDEQLFASKLEKALSENSDKVFWCVFENLNEPLTDGIEKALVDFVEHMQQDCRAIFVGRERPGEGLLELLWKRKMELITQKELLFSEKEVSEMVSNSHSNLSARELYAATGGWPGCVDMMIRFAIKYANQMDINKLLNSYEIKYYIWQMIVQPLAQQEKELIHFSKMFPWLDAKLCGEVYAIERAGNLFEILERKGILVSDSYTGHWTIAPLFYGVNDKDRLLLGGKKLDEELLLKQTGKWYEEQGHLKEALECYGKTNDLELYRECMVKHYEQIPFLGIAYENVMEWENEIPQLMYLRGMYCYEHQEFDGLEREIVRIKKLKHAKEEKLQDDALCDEIWINLCYANPNLALDEWLALLGETSTENLRLYNVLGNGQTYLCGVRDLTGLFACTKKEENKKAKIWKEKLDAEDVYKLARIDYYLETERIDAILQEDLKLLNSRSGVAELRLQIKVQKKQKDAESRKRIGEIEKNLRKDGTKVEIEIAESMINMYSPLLKQTERMMWWLRNSEKYLKIEVTEQNYVSLFYLVKGYMYLKQYKKAEKILTPLIAYMQTYRRGLLLAECLYQMAIIKWQSDLHGQALQYMIESFLISRQARYVDFYAEYGKQGQEVIEAYIEWMEKNAPEGWHRKKKYNYGNVLRMPEADYLVTVLRKSKKEARETTKASEIAEDGVEELTMMENIILQDINRGLSNAQICEELNLKLPTVKGHIYNLYKKLGVNNRVQAIMKGKERGLL